MKKTLLFVRERAKDEFIKNANQALKFVNNVAKEARKAGFSDSEAWKIAEIAYQKPNPTQLESRVIDVVLSTKSSFEIGGLKLSAQKVAELMEKPNLSEINNLIENAKEAQTDFNEIQFDKILNGDKIEFAPDWLTEKLESFTIYTENEGHAKTFQVFTELVKNINKLAAANHQRNFFGFLENEGLVKWENSYFVIETKSSSLERLFLLFGTTEETINKREAKGLKFSGK